MRVKFSTMEEFLEELTKEASALQVEEGIVRVTFLHRQDTRTSLDNLSIYAGAVMRDKIVELRQFIGQMWHIPGGSEQDDKVSNAARTIQEKMVTKARELN